MSTIDLGALADGIMPRDPSDHGYLERIAQALHGYGVPAEIARTDIALAYMHGYSAGLVAGVQHDTVTADTAELYDASVEDEAVPFYAEPGPSAETMAMVARATGGIFDPVGVDFTEVEDADAAQAGAEAGR